MDINRFKQLPILGIIRGIRPADVEPIVESAISAGLETIEITMNTDGADGLIRKAVKASRGSLTVGAGTVLDIKSLKSALSAGASFIVMPALIESVVKYCAKKKIPVFPGALTPQEVYNAWNAGATMVKVFPSGFFGPAYFRELLAPFNDIELLACGGVTPENMAEYFDSGASAVSFGASVFRKDWLLMRDYPRVADAMRKFVLSYRQRGKTR